MTTSMAALLTVTLRPAALSVAVLSAFLFVVVPSRAQAGAIVETVSRELPGGQQTGGTTLYVDGGNLRVASADAGEAAGGSNAIVKGDVLYAIDHQKRTYAVLDRATLKQLAQNMNEAMRQMDERLENMEPGERARVEAATGRAGGPRGPAQYQRTNRSETVSGKSCRMWEGRQRNKKFVEYCVVPYSAIAGGAEVAAAMKNMIGLMEDVMTALDESGTKDALFSSEWRGVQALDGYPILIRMFDNGQPVAEEVLKSAREAAVPAAQFEVPAGYQEQKAGGEPGAETQQESGESPGMLDLQLPEKGEDS